jgi:hypothetical protein
MSFLCTGLIEDINMSGGENSAGYNWSVTGYQPVTRKLVWYPIGNKQVIGYPKPVVGYRF